MKHFECTFSAACGTQKKEVTLNPSLAARDVQIAPQYVGICGSDLIHFEQSHDSEIKIGHEWVGRVVEVGSDVTNFKHGDVVTSASYISCGKCTACLSGDSHRCENGFSLGRSELGVARTRLNLPAHSLIKLNQPAAPLGIMFEVFSIGLEAVEMLRRVLDSTRNQNILIIGSGPIGVAVAKCLQQEGHKPLITDRRMKRVKWAKDMGIDSIPLPFAMSDDSLRNSFNIVIDCSAITGGDPGALEHLTHFSAESAKILIIAKYRKTDKLPFFVLSNRRCSISFLSSASTNRLEETLYKCDKLINELAPKYITHIFDVDQFDDAIKMAFEKNDCGKIIVKIQE